MQYFLKTGYGESTSSYGGTVLVPNSGLGQGSGASPPGFSALSSLIVNAYRRLGHGAKVLSSYTRRLFHLAAVMYVDDTDLLHWPALAYIDPEELVMHVQAATTDYGLLAQASGGILKEAKCSVYFLDYKYVKGRAVLKSLQDLPTPNCFIPDGDLLQPSHISIPQPLGPPVPIVTHDVSTASKMLGVHFSPAGNSAVHVEHMVQKGLDWVDSLRTKPVASGDAWLSFYLQLYPGLSWGLVTVCMHPKRLDAQIQRIYSKALPSLGVNRNIKREWRTLPEQYQGLGMPNFPLVALADKLSFLLGNWGFYGLAHSDALAMAYENFLVEVGLYGSPLDWSYEDYGHLATGETWFGNLWHLVHVFGVRLSFRSEDTVTRVRAHDRSLISEFFRIGYKGRDLAALNVVRRFRNLLHMSDIAKADGTTLDDFVLSDRSEVSVSYTFPREEPTKADFGLWQEAISRLCSGTTQLPYPLGRFLKAPHLPSQWLTTLHATELYFVPHNSPTRKYDVYRLRRNRVSTRHGRQIDLHCTHSGQHPGTHTASATMTGPTCAILHSLSPLPITAPPPLSFHEVLLSYGNDSLWENMVFDGDGSWIGTGIAAGSLALAHDGSYMASESVHLCSAGVILFCTTTKQCLKASISERSDAASNYRGELLGAVMAMLILRAALVSLDHRSPPTTLHCDNRGVIHHCNSPLTALKEKQKQADLIRLLKYLGSTNRTRTTWEWVEGHAVDRKGRRHSSLPERLNDQADRLAKAALLSAIAGGHVMTGDFPFEVVKLEISGKRVRGSPRLALDADWGYRYARKLFHEKDIVCREDFHLVWWEGMAETMSRYPKMYRVWMTKHVSGFCGNNVQQYYWNKGDHSPKCEFCGWEDEYTSHICRCEDPGRDCMFRISVGELTRWMTSTLGEPYTTSTVEGYLLGRGRVTMESCHHGTDTILLDVCRESDRLGWDSFIKGRITTLWLSVVAPHLSRGIRQILPRSWGRHFITKLHNVVHTQWIYRNSMIHFRSTDGLTIPEHHEILDQMEIYSLVDPDTLLPRHRTLLDVDFESLGSGPTSHRLLWMANMSSAMSAAHLARSGTLSESALAHFSHTSLPTQPE
jgi:ribonuclease HI